MVILIKDAFDESLPLKLASFGEVTSDESRLKEADVLLIRSKTKCTREFLSGLDKLKVIIRGGVGMDNIDKEACKEKGIIALNTPKSSAIAVAELAFSLMLSIPNNIVFYDNTMKKGEWNKKTKRHELYGKTLALLGYGHIPREMSKRAKAFGMNVVAYDKYLTEADVPLLPSMEDAVRNADFISMHLPLTDETRNLFNAEMFSYFKPGAILLNTARGAIVDENALYDALTTGKLRACGSDVFVDESTSFTSPLNKLDNFIGFPHVAANTQESMYNMAMWAVEGLIDVIEGREPKYLYKY